MPRKTTTDSNEEKYFQKLNGDEKGLHLTDIEKKNTQLLKLKREQPKRVPENKKGVVDRSIRIYWPKRIEGAEKN